MDALRARGVFFDRGQGNVVVLFQQMCGFAARGGASVQHALSCANIHQLRAQLRTRILHRDCAFGKLGQSRHGAGRIQQQGLWRQIRRLAAVTGGGEHVLILRHAVLLRIHAQGHRRMAVVDAQNRLPIVRILRFEHINPPLRMVVARNFVFLRLSQPRLALAQEAPQNRVRHAFGVGFVVVNCQHGFVDQREFVFFLQQQLRQRDTQHGLNPFGRRVGNVVFEPKLRCAPVAQCVKGQALYIRTRLLVHANLGK